MDSLAAEDVVVDLQPKLGGEAEKRRLAIKFRVERGRKSPTFLR